MGQQWFDPGLVWLHLVFLDNRQDKINTGILFIPLRVVVHELQLFVQTCLA